MARCSASLRKFLAALLSFACFAAVMACVQKARGGEPEVLAKCDDKTCVMSKEDYESLKAFIRETYERAEANDRVESDVNDLIVELRGRVSRCESRRGKDRS